MSTITPHYRSVQQLLQSQSFSIDEYQREYKWEKKNIDDLLNDLLEKFRSCYHDGHETRMVQEYEDYFLGSIIVSKRNGKNYLVDGQQRVTSLTLLLIYLYRAFQSSMLPLGPNLVMGLAPLIFSDNLGTPRFNLDIVERLPVIDALFNGKPFTPDGKDESIQTMYARYNNIEQLDLTGELGAALPHFAYWLMKKVGLIEIATDNDDYAYAIFETMNDRGKPLSPVDMLKAYVLAPVEDEAPRRAANQTWKQQVLRLISWGGEQEPERDANCIKAWFRAQYAETIRDRKAGSLDKDWELIGSAFHRWARDRAEHVGLGRTEQNLGFMNRDLPFFAGAYLRILEASRKYTPGLEAVFYNAHNEFTWQNTVLLAPLCTNDSEDMVRRKLAVTATYLDIWLMRRATNYIRVTYASTAYAMFLLCRDIRRKPLDELVGLLRDKLAKDDVTFEGSESRGRTGIEGFGVNQFSKRYVYHLLGRLTAYTDVGAGKPDLFDKYMDRTGKNPCDIEHIWANDYEPYKGEFSTADEFQRFRNHVAGLLLLPADVNRSYQDKSFADKAPHYAAQNMYAASLTAAAYKHQPQFDTFRTRFGLPFKPYAGFGKKEQLERRELVNALVQRIWSPERLEEFRA
ncbi:MAG TPA: DUF262 domain-containing protein [Polyangiales bacterium]